MKSASLLLLAVLPALSSSSCLACFLCSKLKTEWAYWAGLGTNAPVVKRKIRKYGI